MHNLIIGLFFFILFASPSMPYEGHEYVVEILHQDSKDTLNNNSFTTELGNSKDITTKPLHQSRLRAEVAISRKRWVY